MQFQINEMTEEQAKMAITIKVEQEHNAKLMAEKDSYKDDAEELLKSKKKVEFDADMKQ